MAEKIAKPAKEEITSWGGKREGSGRKLVGDKKRNRAFYITENEYLKVKEFIEQIRKKD